VSALALGTLTFGNETSEAGSFAQLDRFVSAGGTLIDTADVYADGRSEQILGRWLASRTDGRDRAVIATKGRFPTTEDPNGHGLSRRHLTGALDASLRRLGVEAIDLYQLHGWDPLTPVEETLRFLDDAAQAGKILYFGLSNFLAYQIQKYVDLTDAHRLIRPVTVQPQYSMLARAIEWEVVPACQAEGLGLLAWSPLASGWLTGKYRRGEPQPRAPGCLTRWTRACGSGTNAGTWSATGRSSTPCARSPRGRGASMSQVAIAWTMARPAVRSVILGARTLGQLDDNLAAADLELSEDETRLLDAASDPGAPDYPYGERGQTQRDRRISGGRF